LGFPFLVGYIDEQTYVRGPLVLFPVGIEYRRETKTPGWYVFPSNEKVPILNRALLTAIKKNAGLGVSSSMMNELEDLLDRIKDMKSNTELAFIEGLSNLLIENSFPLKGFDNVFDKIKALEPEGKLLEEKQTLHLENFKIIGNFPQGDSAIYFDYEELSKKAKSGETDQGIIDNLLETCSIDGGEIWGQGNNEDNNNNENPDRDIKLDTISADELSLAIESDPSQDRIVVASQDTECLVVRGPPGTGKSQVIVNLISNALAKEKRVLLVCQKRAALDVVYQRLDKIGLAKYIALLHDPTKDRKKLYQQLKHLLKSKTNLDDIDSIISKLRHYSQQIDRLKISQNGISAALWKPYFGGISVHQLYLLSDPSYRSKLELADIAPQVNN
jgi:AAA domain